jgi:hypothetical protein
LVAPSGESTRLLTIQVSGIARRDELEQELNALGVGIPDTSVLAIVFINLGDP